MQRRRIERGCRSARERRQDGVRIEVQQARVVAHKAADERAAGKPREVVVLDCLHLARRELQLLCDSVECQARVLAGKVTGSTPELSFVAPFGVSAMVEPAAGTNQPWLTALWDEVGRIPEHGASNLGVVANIAAYEKGGPWLAEVLKYLDGNRRMLPEILRPFLPCAIASS